MLTSEARVLTDRAERYAKQLAEHLGRKVPVVDGRLTLGDGSCLLSPLADSLMLTATAPDPASLARIEQVVGSHLERFGHRDELKVNWIAT